MKSAVVYIQAIGDTKTKTELMKNNWERKERRKNTKTIKLRKQKEERFFRFFSFKIGYCFSGFSSFIINALKYSILITNSQNISVFFGVPITNSQNISVFFGVPITKGRIMIFFLQNYNTFCVAF